jgi:hypothetical protein
VFGKANSSAINLSAIADASNPTGGFVINGEAAADWSGLSVSSAGDVNGDGLDDLIVGAEGANPNGRSNAGKSYVVFGKAGSSAIDLSTIADANNPTGGFVINGALETEMPLQSSDASPLITNPSVGLFASTMALRLMA